MRLIQCDKSLKVILRAILKFIFFYHLNWISPHSINKLSRKNKWVLKVSLWTYFGFIIYYYMLVHVVGYRKEISVRKCSKVMFAVITLTVKFFSHISKSYSVSSCLQCVYEDCNIVKSLLGHLWSQPGFDSGCHRNLTIFCLLLQWLDWLAWRFSL